MKSLKYKVLWMTFMGFSLGLRAQTDSLQAYRIQAVQNSPAVRASYREYQAALQRVIPAGSLDDPELSAEFFPKPMEHVNGKQVASLTLMQMFPWFGTLRAAKQEKSWMAEAAYQKYRETGLTLVFNVSQSWYAMLAAREQIGTIRENIRLLQNIKEVALYLYKSPAVMFGKVKGMGGGGRMSDQLRIQAEIEKLEEQEQDVESQLALMKRQFNLLLHRDETSPVFLPDTLLASTPPVVNLTLLEVQNPQLSMLKAQSQSYAAQGEKARKMGMPMIGAGVGYMLNTKRSAMSTDGSMSQMNGMDMPMLMLKVSLPIYRKKIRAQERAAALMKASADESYADRIDELHSQYDRILRQMEEAQRKMVLCDNESGILDHTLQLLRTEYTNGVSSVTDILQTQRTLIDFRLKRFEALAAYDTAVAEMEKLAAVKDYSMNKEK